ncbi:MAG: GHMP kinase [Anaerolineae bacterium]|nr:GHMP kinase [Anaerolineae bacterium]MCB9107492.1 GHMP kinase [Anaerolineales bacterium]
MIITRTPLRISFAGGGSDLPAFYEHERGAVVSTAIDKYIYINVNPKFDHKIRASYSVTEIVDTVDELQHELIREALYLLNLKEGIEITSISDIPSKGTGLGSSSSYTVGLLNALYAYRGHMAGAERLASEACHIEIDRCHKPIGKQDQYIAAYGGLQYIRFNSDGSVYTDPVICSPATRKILHSRLLLLYTGLTRSADNILSEQTKETRSSEEKRASLKYMVNLADQLCEALGRDEINAFGEILHAGWLEKRKLATNISNERIDDWYNRGRMAGAIGGKLLGAGGGGFILFFADPAYHTDICRALPELTRVPFNFCPQGSKVIYVEENGYQP